MTEKVHPTARRGFLERLASHDRVSSWKLISSVADVYLIARYGLPDVVVYYSNKYLFGKVDLELLPDEVSRGSFVLILPHASFDPEILPAATKVEIGVGHLSKLFGALNFEHVWEYRSPGEKAAASRSSG